jgi:hypothetical protein
LHWNPSVIEQRTGRVDRLGGKAERVGAPIRVYLPYIAATQDEKINRVVLDRARWFQIMMGRSTKSMKAVLIARRNGSPCPRYWNVP